MNEFQKPYDRRRRRHFRCTPWKPGSDCYLYNVTQTIQLFKYLISFSMISVAYSCCVATGFWFSASCRSLFSSSSLSLIPPLSPSLYVRCSFHKIHNINTIHDNTQYIYKHYNIKLRSNDPPAVYPFL